MSKPKKKSLSKIDPFADREAQKYENPIPSREFILDYLAQAGGPRNHKQVADDLSLISEEHQDALRRRLRAMERDGQLVCNRRGAYGVVEMMDLLRGRVMAHPDGYGFLVPDDGSDDVFLSARQMRSLLHGDRAVVRKVGVDRRGRPEGTLVEVLERANKEIVGRFAHDGPVGFVIPDNKRIHQDILIPAGHAGLAREGQIVVATIEQQPDRHCQPIGRISEIMGDHMAPGMEIDIAIRSYQVPRAWPAEVESESAGLKPTVPSAAKRNRLDLRELPLVTIDGEDARDFDDAVYCEPQADGWRLLVAIADVSHYVLPGTALDKEALNRGNSVYFPDHVIPMLPEVLSNGLCSLNPDVDRLCMVCELDIGPRGKVRAARFHEAVMRSAARLTYTEVNTILTDRTSEVRERRAPLVPHLENLHLLYQLFRKRREQRGAIDFETTETRILFGENRKIERIVPLVRNDAHKMIEEFMVAANVAGAEFLLGHKAPALFRVHEPPAKDKVDDLRTFLGELGLQLGGGAQPSAKDYARLLSELGGRPDAHLVQTVLLRSLKLAVYSPENVGHFGLAFPAYTHFTSPIRRYPDLLVHRAIRHLLRKGSTAGFQYDKLAMRTFGEQCSMTERRADEATRHAVNWLKCEFMLDKVGRIYDGVISAVTSFGLFVELSEIFVEGLVHVTSLTNDYYHFDPVGHRLRGERTGRVYRLANKVTVRVLRVDLDERRLDFEIVEEAAPARRTRGKRKQR
jgi:ribonuclease R